MLISGSRTKRGKAPWQRIAVLLVSLATLGFYCSVRRAHIVGSLPDARLADSQRPRALDLVDRRRSRLTREDLLVAIPTDKSHIPLVRASRSWRRGIRSVVAVNDSALSTAAQKEGDAFLESWVAYPDDTPRRGNYPGDTRAALVPFLAYKHIGPKFKWLLYGDDDTQWFVEGVLKLLDRFDANIPYFITDNLWWSSVNGTIGSQPNLEAPRCLPCGFSAQGIKPAGVMQFEAPEGCPCSPRLLCAAAEPRQYFDAKCSIPRHLVPAFSTRTYSMHGGAGGLISVGLLRAVAIDQMEACIARMGNSTGGDAFITICLWELGHAHTDPGPWFNDLSMRLFDAAADLHSSELAASLRSAGAGDCSSSRCELFDNMVSSHVHSRKAGSIQEAAATVEQLSAAYEAFLKGRALRASAEDVRLVLDPDSSL